jgi:peroxiredoxin (alkyl hydroperoxide reductase subunit C)
VAVAEKKKEIEELDTQVLVCSVDSVFVHKSWNDTELSKMIDGGLTFPMLSDSSGQLGRDYGVYDEQFCVDIRGSFLIDPDGVLQAMEVLAAPVGRNIDETIRQIKAFQYVRNSGGTEAAPADWEPGKKTLRPGTELVGQVCSNWKPGM